ncbi:MAG: hypothetical protein ACJAUD_000902 [Crocinitomicaceae bacterium]|jgi:hypothetical protein
MSRVIKSYSKLHPSLREEVYTGYSDRSLERTSFPYKGKIVDGLIYTSEDVVYLIPISTIIAGRAGSSDDLDDEYESFDIED